MMAKKPRKTPGSKDKQPLPTVNVDFATSEDAGKMTAAKMRSLMCNPIYAGMGPFPALVDDETWVRAASRMIETEGAEQFLVNMLYVLRQSMGTISDGSQDD